MGEPWQKLEKHLTDFKSRKEGRSTKYFIPCEMLTDKAKANMAARFEEVPDELDDFSKEVEDIIGDVSGAEFAVTSEERLREAQIANTEARTRMLSEKLERRKTELFNEWSQAFFEAFSDAFAKFKGELIALQLSEEQLSTLQDKLNLALESLKNKLDFLEQDYANNDDDKNEDDSL